MKKTFTKFLAALALLAFFIPSLTVRADGETITFSTLGYSNTDPVTTVSGTKVDLTFAAGTNTQNSPKYYSTGAGVRMYSGNTLTIEAADGYTITEMVFTYSSPSYRANFGTNVGTYTEVANETTGTWSGNASSIILTDATTCRMQSIAFTYTSGGGSTPSLSVAPSSIAFGAVATNTSVQKSFTITYSNLTANSTINIGGSDLTACTLSHSSVTVPAGGSGSQEVTVTYEPTTAGSLNGTITVSQSQITSQTVSVTGSATAATDYTLITNGNALVEGDKYIIVGDKDGLKAMGYQKTSNRDAIAVTANNNVISVVPATSNTETTAVFELTLGKDNGNWTLYDEVNSGYLYASSSSSNELKCRNNNNTADGQWTIDIASSGVATITAQGDNTRNKMKLNSSGAPFSCYASGQLDVYLYKAGDIPTPPTSYIVTVASGIENGTISVSPTQAVENETVTVTATPAEGYKLATLTYNDGTNTVNINQNTMQFIMPATNVTVNATFDIEILSTMQAIFDKATVIGGTAQNVNVTFGNWVVSGVSTNGKNVFVTDNNGNGFVIYSSTDQSSTYAVGNTISGTAVSCQLKKNYGYAQIGVDANALTIDEGGSVATSDIAMANLAGVNTGALVQYTGLTCSVTTNNDKTYYNLSDGNSTIQVYNSLYADAYSTLVDGNSYNITGVYQQYNSTKEILPRSAADIVEVQNPELNTITAGTLTNVAIDELWDGDMHDITLGDEVAEDTYVYFSLTVEEGYTLESVSVLDANENEIQLTKNINSWSFYMPNSSVTINATATATPTPVITGDIYVKVTSTDDLTGGQYLIVYEDGNLAFNGSLVTLDGVGNTISVTRGTDRIQANNTTTAAEFTINTTSGTIKSASGYYIGQTSDANGLLFSTGTAYTNTISIDNDGNAVIQSSGGAYMRYNSNSDQRRFRYFKSSSYTAQKAIQLYKRVYALSINGYGDDDEVKTGWNLIASPVSVNPSDVENMTSAKFDLYRFNGTPTTANKEWENWKQEGDHQHFDFTTGKGYLYAHNTDVDLLFTGEMATSIADVDLPYDAESNIKSLYLAGNSLQDATTFYVYNGDIEKQNVNFLTINGDGSGFITTTATSFTAQAMQGFFVQSGGEDWTLSTTDMDAKKGNNGLLNIKINRDRGTLIDNAIVSFDKAPQMKKFHLFDNTTSVFIPQNGEEMSVVRTEAHGTMPVNFKAKEMGRYTISVETEGIDMSYLHLIDRLTGEDVNLLLDNEYSFIASNNDSEERFILSFTEKGYDAHGNEIFVYQSGNDLIVNGEGELQIFDVMGRMVKNTVINGVEAIAMPQGVYIFRLNENIQKIVVR